jgi:hypothetical protein
MDPMGQLRQYLRADEGGLPAGEGMRGYVPGPNTGMDLSDSEEYTRWISAEMETGAS